MGARRSSKSWPASSPVRTPHSTGGGLTCGSARRLGSCCPARCSTTIALSSLSTSSSWRGLTLLAQASCTLPLQPHPSPYSLARSGAPRSSRGCNSGVAGAGTTASVSVPRSGPVPTCASTLTLASALAITLALSLSTRSLALAALYWATALSSFLPASCAAPSSRTSLPPIARLAHSPRNSSTSLVPQKTSRVSTSGMTMA